MPKEITPPITTRINGNGINPQTKQIATVIQPHKTGERSSAEATFAIKLAMTINKKSSIIKRIQYNKVHYFAFHGILTNLEFKILIQHTV